ncbi:uncharacterized protein LOC119403355 [Rhipicephalus sanguineus]|uniref:uncharacterized protein LOC119403355 n=1 Tax=Rhipicephalus sanguineus TaxID=34632 RepID=UPI0018939443|nr:uncharacterized protein LOC119403355 [Rhipicephalus sanguineus]
MLQSTVPSPETTTAFKQQWSVTRPPRPAARANTQLPGLLVPDTYVYREGREEPMSSITVFKDPPEPLKIPEPLHILSSTMKKPAPEPPVMAPDAPPIPPLGPSDAHHLNSGESLNEAEVSAKVIIEDRSQEPKSTGGSDGDISSPDLGSSAGRDLRVDVNPALHLKPAYEATVLIFSQHEMSRPSTLWCKRPPTARSGVRQDDRRRDLRPAATIHCYPLVAPSAEHVELQRGRDLRPQRGSQCRPPESSILQPHTPRHEQERPPRHSQYRPPETFSLKMALQGPGPVVLRRPTRHSQCRPPEISALHPTQSHKYGDLQRPARNSQFRPPETFPQPDCHAMPQRGRV